MEEISSEVNPLLHVKVYGEDAPLGVKFIAPLLNSQLALVTTEEIDKAEEAETLMDDVAVQLSKLVTVTL
jgi:hypothetical protein